MTRLLFWLALAFLVIYAVRKKLRAASAPPPQSGAARPGPAARERVETMLPCTRCGMHVPHSEAVLNSAGLAFCSEEHRRLHDGA